MIELTKVYEEKKEKLKARLEQAEQTREKLNKQIASLKKQLSEIDSKGQYDIIGSFIASAKEQGMNFDSLNDLQDYFNELLNQSSGKNKKEKSVVKESLTTDLSDEIEVEEDDELGGLLADDDEEVASVLDRIRKE